MEDQAWLTILVAVLGSGALSAVITLVAARFRHDRQVDQLESWTKELKLLDDLDQRAGLAADGGSQASRALAVAVAARMHLNATIARRIVPAATWEGYFLVAVGVTTGFLGLMLGVYGLSGAGDVFGSAGSVVLGSVLLALGILLVLVGVHTDGFRTRMRDVIERTLLGAAGVEVRAMAGKAAEFEQENQWVPGGAPTFPRRYRIVVPYQVRQSFTTYLVNLGQAEMSEDEGQDQYDAGADPDPSASDGAHHV